MKPDSLRSLFLIALSVIVVSVVGQFVAGKVDTLILEPTCEPDYMGKRDGEEIWKWWQWRVHSVKGTVADIKLSYTLCPQICYTGDLDGNGTDGLRIMRRNYSNLVWYNVITYRDGAWHRMTKSIFVHQACADEYDIANYTTKPAGPGYITAFACRNVYRDSDWMG